MEEVIIREGSAVKISVIFKGEIIDFKLGVIEVERIFGPSRTELRYISDKEYKGKRIVVRSIYSGGQTGGGIDENQLDYAMRGKEYNREEVKIITTDLKEVSRLIEEDKEKDKREAKEFDELQERKVKALNKLPKTFDITLPYGNNLYIKRNEAYYNRVQSRVIQIYTEVCFKGTNKDSRIIDACVGKKGRILSKELIGYPKYYLNEDVKLTKDAARLIINIVNDRYKEVKSLIEKTKQETE